MKKTMKTFALASALGLLSSASFAAEKVNIGMPSWTGAQAIAHLLAEVVESRIGGEAEHSGEGVVGLARGPGRSVVGYRRLRESYPGHHAPKEPVGFAHLKESVEARSGDEAKVAGVRR